MAVTHQANFWATWTGNKSHVVTSAFEWLSSILSQGNIGRNCWPNALPPKTCRDASPFMLLLLDWRDQILTMSETVRFENQIQNCCFERRNNIPFGPSLFLFVFNNNYISNKRNNGELLSLKKLWTSITYLAIHLFAKDHFNNNSTKLPGLSHLQ